MARPPVAERRSGSWAEFKDFVHMRLVQRLDPARVATIKDPQLLARELRLVVERLVDMENPLLNLMERERLIDEILDDAFGFGPLEPLFCDDRVREIRVESAELVLVRKQESFERADVSFRSLEQLYLICGRLLLSVRGRSLEPPLGTVVERETPAGFFMKADFPASRLQSPTLHFRRLG